MGGIGGMGGMGGMKFDFFYTAGTKHRSHTTQVTHHTGQIQGQIESEGFLG